MLTNKPWQLVARRGMRVVELAPQLLRHPGHVRAGIRGVHVGVLGFLDKPWLRNHDFGTVLDVGANTGQFAVASHVVFPRATIHSFEPLPSAVATLKRKTAHIPGHQVYSCAVGDVDGRVVIHESPSSPSSSILNMTGAHIEAFPWTEGAVDVEVEIHRLDTLLPELALDGRVLLKIDVQGFGEQVLRGAPETLKRVDMVIVETSFVSLYEGETTFDEVYEIMSLAGMAFIGFVDQLEHPKTGQVLQADAIFTPRATRGRM